MKKIGVFKESFPKEKRIALVPSSVEKLKKLSGIEIFIPSGYGHSLFIEDSEFLKAGAKIVKNPEEIWQLVDIFLHLHPPTLENVNKMKPKTMTIGFLNPFDQKELLNQLAKKQISSLSIELLPRSTIAQKMDALSSQANLAGYMAVIKAAGYLNKIFPMMTTPSGTIFPAKVFIIGVGIAGLQAIATARRLGAKVEAFDTRPSVEEQVLSLGAKFVKVDLGKTEATSQGYAKALTSEQLEKQKEAMTKVLKDADVVITTAQVFGKKAPLIVTKEMLGHMKKGSVVVDMAIETGGNVEMSKINEVIDFEGITIVGLPQLATHVSKDASFLYASNLTNLLETFYKKESQSFVFDLQNVFLKECLVTHEGQIINPKLKT